MPGHNTKDCLIQIIPLFDRFGNPAWISTVRMGPHELSSVYPEAANYDAAGTVFTK